MQNNQTPEAQTPSGFQSLGLSEAVLAAVQDMGYVTPTPVQEQAIPHVLAGRDLLAAAQTGTGKTAAFLLPTIDRLPHARYANGRGKNQGGGPLMLVLTPTRELAQQIEGVCTPIARRTQHRSVTVVGGVGYNPQISAIHRGCDILVATPGRLEDLMAQGACNLDEVQVLVLDEADRMLDMGFIPAVRRIVSAIPGNRQTLLFSATLDEKSVGQVADLVRDPVRVEIAPATSTAETVDQYVLPVSVEAKNALLAQVLKKFGPDRAIVFTRTKHRADSACRRLNRCGIKAEAIHGDRNQSQRQRALAHFAKGSCQVLVATDVLARGIDISDVSYVVNFDVPEDPVDYIHRIGRTGRAGEAGWSLTFVTADDVEEFYDIEALMQKTADIADTDGLELGESPVAVDPNRVPKAKPADKREKKRRRQKAERKASVKSSSRSRKAPRKGADAGEKSNEQQVKPVAPEPTVEVAPERPERSAHRRRPSRAERIAKPASEKREARGSRGNGSAKARPSGESRPGGSGAARPGGAPKSARSFKARRRHPGDRGGRK